MDNQERLATLDTQDTRRRQAKQKHTIQYFIISIPWANILRIKTYISIKIIEIYMH